MNIAQPAGIADYTDPTACDFAERIAAATPPVNSARTAETDRIAAEVALALGLGTDTAAI